MKRNKLILTGLLATSLLVGTSTAQADLLATSQSIFGFDFRFNNPGARANGMGGAFIGLADDATAAYTNPAGLTILTKPEISLEYKLGEYTTVITEEHGSGPSTSFQEMDYTDSVQGPSFISFVYPNKKATVAIYRHQMVNIENNLRYQSPSGEIQDCKMDIKADTIGLGFGLKLAEPFSLGISAGFTEMGYKEHTSIQKDPDTVEREYVDGTDKDVHLTASLLWQPTEKIGVGLVYREGPKFTFRKIGIERVTFTTDTGSVGGEMTSFNLEHDIKIPDSYGIGFSYHITPQLTTALDVNYIEYSDLTKHVSDQGGHSYDGLFETNDTYEAHLGLEYVVDLKSTPLALRGGYYYRPAHLYHFVGHYNDPVVQTRVESLMPEGKDDHIFSLGFGALVSENVQLDISGSAGKFVKEGTASLVYRFD